MTTKTDPVRGWNPASLTANTASEKEAVHLTISDGFRFGIGFALAGLIFTIVVFIAMPLGLAALLA